MLRRWVRTASGFSPPVTSFFALRSFLTSFMGLRVRPRLKRRRMRARKRSTSASVFMSRSCSRSVPRKENLRKVRFLGASATRASSSDCGGGEEKRGRGGERRVGSGGRLEKHPRGGSSPKKTPSPIARSGSGREASTAARRATRARDDDVDVHEREDLASRDVRARVSTRSAVAGAHFADPRRARVPVPSSCRRTGDGKPRTTRGRASRDVGRRADEGVRVTHHL